jgi:predicted metalloprotease with PDZ domain
LLDDFKKFTQVQFHLFGSFPFSEYHFLFLFLPEKFYHGVEHLNSTVIALGPSYGIMNTKGYEDLLGVSSHEQFHAWNIKTIRPVEMMPYDYSRENYSRLGYVAEGVTTYYGDVMLLRSGVFTEEQYLKTFNENLEKHFNNFGRLNLSVADSSFDTWLDGYKAGVPGRKSSIYTEGALCAFILDMLIRKNTNNKKSLDDLMRLLYEEFGKKHRGYSESDYKTAAEKIAGIALDDFFENYINGVSSYVPELTTALNYIGYELKTMKKNSTVESSLGFKTQAEGGKTVIAAIYPNSPADKAGLSAQDEIIAVNGMRVENNLNDWCVYFSNEKKIVFTVSTNKRLREVPVMAEGNLFYLNYSVAKQPKPTAAQRHNYDAWAVFKTLKDA